jgi:hypothetical protein
MIQHLKTWIIFAASCTVVNAATVVTAKERLSGVITAQNDKTVTLKRDTGEQRIPRDQIVQIFDDNGELIWTSPALTSGAPVTTSSANASEGESGYHKHDGFFLRLLGGYGSLAFSESPVYANGTGTFKASGPAGFFGFHIGFALFENVILYGALSGYAASNPQYELNGVKATATTSNSLGINSYGAGLSLYLDSINAYISADVGTAKTQLTVTNTQAYSESGLGINVLIGKEWWVSKNWGLGAALFYHYSSMNDVATGSVVPKITNSVFGLAFSATYN